MVACGWGLPHNRGVRSRSQIAGILAFSLLLSLTAPALGDSPNYVIKVWGADDRLTEGSVTDVAQTPEGYLWVGTLFGSVLRFDGIRFVSYNSANTPEFSLKWGVPRLMVDREGTLWISMHDGGLTTWDKQGFHSVFTTTNQLDRIVWSGPGEILFAYADGRLLAGRRQGGPGDGSRGGPPHQQEEQWNWELVALPGISSSGQICADADGRVWYLREGNEFGTWTRTQTNVVSPGEALAGQRIRVLTTDQQQRIWVGTDKALAEWQHDHFAIMTPTNGEPVLNVKRIVSTGGGDLWVEANGRMRRSSGQRWVAESEKWRTELGRTAPRFIHGDSRGGLWAGAGDLGLINVLADGSLHRLTTKDGLPSNTIQFAMQDRDGDIWTGYDRGGLVQIRPRLFRSIGREEGLSDSLVNTVCEGAPGTIWIGTHSGVADRCADGTCTNVTLPGPARAQDSCVTSDADGGVWIGAQGSGLWRWKNGELKSIASQAELQGYPRLLLSGRGGRLWVGTVWSIFQVTNDTLALAYTAEDVGGHPTAIAEGADGTMWAGTLAGDLLRSKGSDFAVIQPPDRGVLGRIWALWPTADGGLWAGTEQGGLLHYANGVFHRFTTKEGLPSDSIVQVMMDGAGNLWLGTRAGIVRIFGGALARFERGELDELPVNVYGQTDGLLTIGSAIIYQPNCWRGRDGTLYFAMANSVSSVNPEEVHINPLPPTIALEEVRFDDQSSWPKRPGAILTTGGDAAVAPPPTIKVGPGRGDLEFQYTGLSLNSPQRVRFKYRLEGLETAWNDAGNDRKAVYRHLSPNDYVFHVIACNSDSVWSRDAALVAVTVEPHFYQTGLFKGGVGALAALGLCGSVAVTMRRRHRRRVEQMERQHEMERERSRIAQDLHDDLGAGLTEIGLLGGMLQDPNRFTSRKQEALERIVQRCRDLVMALDEIVWAVNPRNDSVNSLGGYFGRYAQGFFEPTAIRCRLETHDADSRHPLSSEQRHNLFLAFKEALTNVARHSGASEVAIRISEERGEELVVCIEDNGHGLPDEVRDSADGLINLHKRLARIGGQCEINSRPGGGVSVRLTLSIARSNKGNV